MFRKTAAKILYPEWCKRWPRYTRLDQFDRLLDGTFYDHLPYAFYDEMENNAVIKLEERRPSSQFRLPRMVARWSSRKLFAGRHRPKLRLKDKEKLKPVNRILRKALFWQTMAKAVLWGSVGSVAVMFRVETPDAKTDEKRLALYVWRAKYCKPSFDEFGDLAQLRVSYTARGSSLVALGLSKDYDDKDIDETADYWFIRDYERDRELTYIPVKKDDWNPVDGFTGEGRATKQLRPFEDMTVDHGLGFVPGHWFVNLAGGEGSDGDCTWADAIPNSIELDYTLSQLGRGTRYNAAPQLVIRGELINDGDMTRGPAALLQVRAGYKEDDGMTIGEGDAKLLEMAGTGVDAGLKLIDKLRNYALEQIAAARKDPDKMKAPLSGRAMEYLDEESNDLVMDLRSQYGEDGALPLIKKIALAAELISEKEVGAMTLQWPRLFQPTPDELFALAQAIQIFLDPLGHSAAPQPGKPGTPDSKGADGTTKPGTPDTPPAEAQAPDEENQIMTVEEAKAYVRMNMDLQMLDLDELDAEDETADESPSRPSEPTEMVPPPTLIDLDAAPGTPEGDRDQNAMGQPKIAADVTPSGI